MTKPQYQDNIGLIHLMARKCFGWTCGMNLPLTYDDVFQEMSITFLTCADKHDPETGFKFSAYFSRSAENNMNKLINRQFGRARPSKVMDPDTGEPVMENGKPVYHPMGDGLRFTSFEDMVSDDVSVEEIFAGPTMNPEEVLELAQEVALMRGQLSSVANVMIDMLIDPPDELIAEIHAEEAYIEEASKQNCRLCQTGMSITGIGRFLKTVGVSATEITKAEREIRKAAREL